ncbi:HAD family phosphatase [Prevotella sp. A2931]|uniref:HAD family phosphatase n=1 Tax=Prevotella illustrans TaxID=2800387 RepID=A0ABS3M7D5_9BACT|nr:MULTISPECIES: HAD family phosphatase [Prevotella]MBO1364049.1 HAD family phosphatase [Prevotella illustrans]PTL25635.1 phosphatase [Prevotella sp. oral taxon 820]
MKKVFLFDLDGVIFDTEHQYSALWQTLGSKYLPGVDGFENKIKGQTLEQIFETYFPGMKEVQTSIIEEINSLEKNMNYTYIPGFEHFIENLRSKGFHAAVVTSSNLPKMEQVYIQHPEFIDYFDRIFTSEDFTESKPHPQCYLMSADYFKVTPEECIGFEDSINGLKSVRAAGMTAVALETTNSRKEIAPLADLVIPHYKGLEFDDILKLIPS